MQSSTKSEKLNTNQSLLMMFGQSNDSDIKKIILTTHFSYHIIFNEMKIWFMVILY